MKIAVLAAAGWKAAGDGALCPPDCPDFLKPLEGCPNALLPIGGEQTILSRLAGQLTGLGFQVYAGVGRPGCLYPRSASAREGLWGRLRGTVSSEAIRLGKQVSPWTAERIAYVTTFARVVAVPDPDRRNCFHTYSKVLREVGGGWDRLLLMHGDVLLRPAILEKVAKLEPPCVYVLTRLHDIFWFDEDSLSLFLSAIGQVLDIPRTPGNQVVDSLRKSGVPVVEHGPFPSDDWCDVDYPRSLPPTGTGLHVMSYERALEWVKRERDA